MLASDEYSNTCKRKAKSEISPASKRYRVSDPEFFDFESDCEEDTRPSRSDSTDSPALLSERRLLPGGYEAVANKIDRLCGVLADRVGCLEKVVGEMNSCVKALVSAIATPPTKPDITGAAEIVNLRKKLSNSDNELEGARQEMQRLKQELDQVSKELSKAQLEGLDDKRQLEEANEALAEAQANLKSRQMKQEPTETIIREIRMVSSNPAEFAFEIAETNISHGMAQAFELVTKALKNATSDSVALNGAVSPGDKNLRNFVISQGHLSGPTWAFPVEIQRLNKLLESPSPESSVAELTELFKNALKAPAGTVDAPEPGTPGQRRVTPRKRLGPARDFVLGKEKMLSHLESSILKAKSLVVYEDELHLWFSALKTCAYPGTDNWHVALLVELLDAARISLTEKTEIMIHKDEHGKHRVYKNLVRSLKDRLAGLKGK